MLARRIVVVLFLALTCLGLALARTYPQRGNVIVRPIEGTDTVRVEVRNNEPSDITMHFDTRVTNMRSTAPLDYTLVVGPNETRTVYVLTVNDSDRRWDWAYEYTWTWGRPGVQHDDRYVYALPYKSGTAYEVIQGYNGGFSHSGEFQYSLDFGMPEGTRVLACREGTVVGVRDTCSEGAPDPALQNFDNYIIIRHPDGTMGEYNHFKQGGALVRPGDYVKRGQAIGLSGNVGYSTGPHLHFFVYRSTDGRERESIPVRFETRGDPAATLIEGATYTAP